jgi:hypothetical protein
MLLESYVRVVAEHLNYVGLRSLNFCYLIGLLYFVHSDKYILHPYR